MLTYEQIKQYYDRDIYSRLQKNILVEYLQSELLDSLFKQEAARVLSFMGGTAIRIVYGSKRFSEDLDFDNFGISFDDLSQLTANVKRDMELKGFTVQFRLVEKGAYHCYIKFPNILKQNRLSNLPEEKILVRIDTVLKDRIFEPTAYTLDKFDVFRAINVNPPSIILSQKLITILERKREKGRDFYDTIFLFGLAGPDFDYIEKTMKLDRLTFIDRLLDHCSQLNYHLLAQDVKPFLIDPAQSERIEQFGQFIKQKLTKTI